MHSSCGQGLLRRARLHRTRLTCPNLKDWQARPADRQRLVAICSIDFELQCANSRNHVDAPGYILVSQYDEGFRPTSHETSQAGNIEGTSQEGAWCGALCAPVAGAQTLHPKSMQPRGADPLCPPSSPFPERMVAPLLLVSQPAGKAGGEGQGAQTRPVSGEGIVTDAGLCFWSLIAKSDEDVTTSYSSVGQKFKMLEG